MNLLLEKRDRICFFGDSIVQNGLWIAEVYQYFVNHFSDLEIMMFNCGIAGTSGFEANIKNRMYCDLFNFFPKYAVIMFGMNDINRDLYEETCTVENKEEKREQRILDYKKSLETIVDLCKKESVIPVICSPTPYDEYNHFESNNLHIDNVLLRCSDIANDVAKENGLLYIDMRTIILDNIDKKPIGEDRIHPNEFGNHLMAESFLSAIGVKNNIESDKQFILSEKNKKRFEIEGKIRTINFVERAYMLWQRSETKPIDERKAEVKQRMLTDKAWLPVYNMYLENVDYRDELLGELILTSFDMYSSQK